MLPLRVFERSEFGFDSPGAEAGRFASADDWPPERKLRLFACGCCRLAWNRLAPACRRAVRVAERYADGRAGANELAAAWRACRRFEDRGQAVPMWHNGSESAFSLTTELVHTVALPVLAPSAAWAVANDLRPWRGDSAENALVDRAHRGVWADVFGSGTRGAFDPAWRTAAVLGAARDVYRERAFQALPALAVLLERAGCDRSDILDHCRGPGPHARGCWVVDLVLSRDENRASELRSPHAAPPQAPPSFSPSRRSPGTS